VTLLSISFALDEVGLVVSMAEDIEHDTSDALAGGIYGEVVEIMRRPLLKSASPPESV
jgi:hypothetical protein